MSYILEIFFASQVSYLEKKLGAHRAHTSPCAHPLVVPRDWLGRSAGPARPRPRSWLLLRRPAIGSGPPGRLDAAQSARSYGALSLDDSVIFICMLFVCLGHWVQISIHK
jgi:hypothetical protein